MISLSSRMKSGIINIGIVAWLASKPAQGQPALGAAVQNLDRKGQCSMIDLNDESCFSRFETPGTYFDNLAEIKFGTHEEEDPKLANMPGLDFKAYRRGDISEMYGEPPGSRIEKEPAFRGQAGKFVNMSPDRLDIYWDNNDGTVGHFLSSTGPFGSSGTSTFPGHVFNMVRPKSLEKVCTFKVQKGTSVYFCDPFVDYDQADPSAGVRQGPKMSLDTLTSAQLELYQSAQFNREFGQLYKNFTGGSEWLANYPTEAPRHHMWRADYFGQEHLIQTKETHFIKTPPKDLLQRLDKNNLRRNVTDIPALAEYRAPGTMNITIKAVSVEPRIFQIDGFLSDIEVDLLLELAHQNNLQRSTTGLGGKESSISEVRTSRTTWLPRSSSPIMDAILRRGADVLNIDEAMFRHRDPDERNDYTLNKDPINEDLQIVHYDVGQQYTAHHDFGYPDHTPNAPARSINLCLYLNDGDLVGGETAFPRARNAETDEGIKGVPKKGKAMIFYMKNPDGNLDDLSQHAAMPVINGEKWFANLWTWDPVRG